MRKRFLFIILGMTCLLSLSACKKTEEILPTETQQVTEQSSEEDKFAVSETFYDKENETREDPVVSQSKEEKRLEEVESEIAVYNESQKEVYESEAEKREVVVENTDNSTEVVDIQDIEDGYINNIIDGIKQGSYKSLDDVYKDIDTHYTSQDASVIAKIKEQCKEVWEYWEKQFKDIANQAKPWTKEELEENPVRAEYTREEFERLEKATGGSNKKTIAELMGQ